MTSILILVLIALWLVGLFTEHSFGGAIHLLLVAVAVVVLVRALRTRGR